MLNLNKTLSEIDKIVESPPPEESSGLVKKFFLLRKKPLKHFTIEDLRFMIGQNQNLEVLIPLAIEKLTDNVLAEGNFYEGDLLVNVLSCDSNFWKNHKSDFEKVKMLYNHNIDIFESNNTFRKIRNSFAVFQTLL